MRFPGHDIFSGIPSGIPSGILTGPVPAIFGLSAILLLMGCGARARLPDEWRSRLRPLHVTHDGIERKNLLYVPEGKGPFPLVLAFHGGGGTPAHAAALDGGELLDHARRRGFAVAFPHGVDKHWNDHRNDAISQARRTNRDDVGFARTLLDEIGRAVPIDPSRVYATGISNGGFFSQRLACEMSDRLAGVVVVAATLPEPAPAVCRPTRPVAMIFMNGTNDPLVPYGGGQVRAFFRERGAVLSTDTTMAFWAKQAQCSEKETAELPVLHDDDPTRVVRRRWRCPGTRLELYQIKGGGHTWPGGRPYLGEALVGRVSRQMSASLLVADLVAPQTP